MPMNKGVHGMRYQLYRSVPVVWRSSRCIQFGVDSPVLIDGLTAADTELINAIRMGISARDFDARAAHLDVSPARAASLLSLLTEAGVLMPVERTAYQASSTTHVDAYAARIREEPSCITGRLTRPSVLVLGPLRRGLQALLVAAGMRADIIDRAEDALTAAQPLVVLTGAWVDDAVGAGFLHEHGIDHCHLTVGQDQARLSHVIRAQDTPCTRCAIGFRCDDDADWFGSWQALWQQAPSASLLDPVLCALAYAHQAERVREHILNPGCVADDLVVSAGGEVVVETPEFHASCDCRASVLQHLSRV